MAGERGRCTKVVSSTEDDGGLVFFDGTQSGFAAGLGKDALKKRGGRLRTGRLQHLHPCRSALSIREHAGAVGAAHKMKVKGGLICLRESAVKCIGQHGLALGAALWIQGSARSAAAELVEVCHFKPPALLYVAEALQVPRDRG
jgi:hypothetical protein